MHHQNFQEESDGEEGGNGVQDPVNSEPVLKPVQRCCCHIGESIVFIH